MKVIVFGVGRFYQNRRERLKQYQEVEIVAFSDNNETLWGGELEGIRVIPPDAIREVAFDCILIMSTYADEIARQLIGSGIEEPKICFWKPFYAKMVQGERKIYKGINKKNEKKTGRNILIISTDLDYNGGSMAAVYAARAIQDKGNHAVLAAPFGNEHFIEETINVGVTVAICPALPYIYEKDREWVNQFEMVIVNVYQMLHSACACAAFIPTLWWLHEPLEIYRTVMEQPWNRIEEGKLDNINIYGVSNWAKYNFNSFFPERMKKVLHYGIPDMGLGKQDTKEKQSAVVFAIIGSVCERKAQDVFVDAATQLGYEEKAEFWIIGYLGQDMFCNKIREISQRVSTIKIKRMLTREEVYRIFPQIDVVVCASREDSLPIVMTEGMMFGKACITTDRTGTADYIHNGENGFVIPAEDGEALKEKMEWAIHNRDKLEIMGKKARETYEKHFTMDIFGENLERAISETMARRSGHGV